MISPYQITHIIRLIQAISESSNQHVESFFDKEVLVYQSLSYSLKENIKGKRNYCGGLTFRDMRCEMTALSYGYDL